MKLYITRHGETEENKLGVLQGHMPGRLSAEGIQQAKALGKRLKNEHFDFIYASDLARVVDTAKEIICYHQNTPFILTEDLRERDFGELQGKNRKDLQVISGLHVEPEHGELKADFFARAKNVLNDIQSKHESDTVLLICHGGIAQAMIANIFGKNYVEMLEMEKLGNTSLSIFNLHQDGNYELLSYNSTDHLN
jgi:probable phosphoglycerate mutase